MDQSFFYQKEACSLKISLKTHLVQGLSTGLEGQDHQEMRHHVLMSDSHYKSRKETPPKPPHENPFKKATKIALKKKNTENKRYGTR
jgi:hypothetical protein